MSDTATQIKPDTMLKEPPMFRVIYINDEITSMDFVVKSLMDFFGYTTENAMSVTEGIHLDGSAIVAKLPFELAEQKGIEVTICARAENYPLQIKLEPETVNE